MSSNRWLLIAIFTLTIIVAVFYFNYSNSTIKPELSNFAVKDTASIDKLFLADKNGNKVTLDRQSKGTWLVNGEVLARKDGIDLLLTTICDLAVRNPVPKSMEQTVIRDLSGAAQRKIEIYSNGNLLKTYYVGTESPDNEGTFMLLEGSSVPFEMHIPGFRGILNVRYNPKADIWSDPHLFRASAKDIKEIEFNMLDRPETGFRLEYDGQFGVKLFDFQNKQIQQVDTGSVFGFLAQFKQLNYEAKVDKAFEGYKTIMELPNFAILKLTKKDGTKTEIQLKRRWASEGQTVNGEKAEYDVDRCYAYLVGTEDLVIAQYFVLDRILVPIQFFTSQ
jgi:hypothetical protein